MLLVKQGKWGESKVSPKFQVVIRSVANVLDVDVGDTVELHVVDHGVVLKKKEAK